ncbi:hypothetical protein EDD15DRAFT_2298132, partial [Pisolithus albus]
MLQNDPEETGSTLEDPSEESEGSSQLRETERPEPHRDRTSEGKLHIDEERFTSDTPPNEVRGMGVPGTPREDLGDSADVEPITTELQISPVSAKMAGKQNTLPRLPEPPPNAPTRTSTPFRDPRRRGRMKTRAESVSNVRTRQSAYLTQAAPKRPHPLLFTPSNRSLDPAGGLWTMNIGY